MIIKNSNLRIFLHENKYKILAIIIAIVLIFGAIKLLNAFAKKSLEQKTQINENKVNSTSPIYTPQETIISGSNISEEKQKTNKQVMENFISYCNNKEIEKAYSLLTDECKEMVFYSDINNFANNYINRIYTTPKTYSMQSWVTGIGYTYKVKILDDILSTGKVNESNVIEDYYTIVEQDDGELKLNISGYIGRKNINKQSTNSNITIVAESKDVYKDYEIYNFKVQNATQNAVMLDSKEATDTVYLKNTNESKFIGYVYEVEDSRLVVNAGYTKTIKIRFNKVVSNKIEIKSVSFDDIITNYDNYKSTLNKKEYIDRLKIIVNL